MTVPVGVGVSVNAGDCVTVGVLVGVDVSVAVLVGVGVPVPVEVGVGVFVGVGLLVSVAVGVGVVVGVLLAVDLGVPVGVPVSVGVGACVVGVSVGVLVSVAVGVDVSVGVAVSVGVGVSVGWSSLCLRGAAARNGAPRPAVPAILIKAMELWLPRGIGLIVIGIVCASPDWPGAPGRAVSSGAITPRPATRKSVENVMVPSGSAPLPTPAVTVKARAPSAAASVL